ncbi:MAG: hypothetical protein JXR07_18590 [Reichenbachiella sp.]
MTLLVLTLSHCNIDQLDFEEIQIPNHQGDFGLALIPAVYTMQDLIAELQDSSLVIEEDNSLLLKVIYRDTSAFEDVDEIVIIEDIEPNPGNISPGFDIPASPTDVDIEHTENLSFNYPISGDEELDSIIYTAGSIRLDITSTFDVDFEFDFVIDDIMDRADDSPIVFSETLTGGQTITRSQSLVNHRTVAERIGNENIFTGTFTGTLLVKTNDVVSPDQMLNYTISISGIEFETIYGYFGEKTFDIQSQTVEIGFFEGIDVGGFTFNDPSINISIDNYIGVPLGADLQNIMSSNAEGDTRSLTGSVVDNLQSVRAPSVNNVGGFLKSLITIDNDNSNIRDLLNISPNLITLEIGATTNHNITEPAENRNFVTSDGKADIYIDLEMPLDVKLEGFSRNFDFSLDSVDVEETDTVRLLARAINLMPFTGMVDLQLVDADSVVLYEFLDILLIESPELLSGRAEEAKETFTEVKLSGESLEAFMNTSRLNLVMSVDSFNADMDEYVKIYSDYQLELKVALRANLNKEL